MKNRYALFVDNEIIAGRELTNVTQQHSQKGTARQRAQPTQVLHAPA